MAATALLFFPISTATPFPLRQNPNLLSLSSTQIPNFISTSRRAVFSIRAVQLATPSRTSVREAAPAVVGGEELLDISKLGISDQIVSALSRRGITELFPIQRAVLEPAMEGRDMIGRAITGSGKTLAFGIPILDKIIQDKSHHGKKRVPSALVLAPTRELARQVQREFKVSAPSLSSTCLYGGIPIMHQVRDLRVGMDIVVGTPGRIIDLVQRGALDLSEVKFAVLDEADQMLAIGFQEDVECILSYLPAKKQCMLFSATMPSWVNDLSRKYLRDPLVIDLIGGSDQKLADGISLYSVAAASSTKQNLLPTLISTYAQGGKSIIFTKTKKDAESLSRSMGSIVGSKGLHGDMPQFQREKTLAAFRDGRFSVLVATDVAARGLDIPNVDLVIHFEMPNSTEFFVHRSGRTGRAGNKGTTVLMFTEGQRRTVRSMERELGCKFEELRGISGSAAGDKQIQYANYGSFQETNVTESEGSFGSYGRSRKSFSSRDSEPRHSRYAQTRTPRNYGDFGNDSMNERKADRNSFQWSPRPSSPKFSTRTESNGSYRSYGDRMNHQNGSSRRYGDRMNNKSGLSRRYGDRMNNQNGSSRSYGDTMNNSNGSSRSYGDRMNNQKGTRKQSSSESGDYDFDHLLDLFKDLD